MTLKYQIGVDAGGTHSTAIAYDLNGKELGRAEGGPGQVAAAESPHFDFGRAHPWNRCWLQG